jgi:hypothetical protein
MRQTAALFSLLLVFAASAAAQSTALLSGTVNDSSGAVIPDAQVVCRHLETGMPSTTVTNAEGLFRFPALPVGAHEVTVTKEGFERLVRRGIVLLTGQTLDVNLTVTVGAVTQSVEVSSPIPLVQTASSEVQTAVDSRQMEDLPLNGRNTFDLAILTPGSVNTEASTVPGQADNGGISVNGLRSIDNNWELDGASYMNRSYGSAPSLPNPDTLQEFSLKSSNFSADSRGGGSSVKMTTRSGTNQLHGTAFEFLRNDALDARNFFAVDPQVYKQNQYGATLGGPIRRDKLFFFASYQGTKKRGNPSPTTLTVPSTAARTGSFVGSGNTIIDPASGSAFPGNIIPQSRLDPVALKLLPFIPQPNSGANLLVTEPNGDLNNDQWLAKADYVLSSRDHLTVRYFRADNAKYDVGSLPSFTGYNQWVNQTVGVSDTHTFGPNWVMTASYNFLYIDRKDTPTSPVTMQEVGAQVPFASKNLIGRMIYVVISGYTGLISSNVQQMHPVSHEAQVTFSYAAGRHLLRFGSGYQRTVDYNAAFNQSDAGNWNFSALRTGLTGVARTGDAVASFLLGLPGNFSQASNTPNNFLMRTFDPWVQDDFRVSRTLTLNFGLRWEPYISPKDTLAPTSGFLPGMQSKVAPFAPRGVVFPGDPGIVDSIVPSYWAVFSPRFGFAWNPGGGKNVVRGGYGIFRSGGNFDGLIRNISTSAPFASASISIPNPPSTANPYANYAGGTPFPYTAPKSLAEYRFAANSAMRLLDAAAHPGYTQSWNFVVERQVMQDTSVSVSYIGNHSLGLMSRYQANPALYGPGATVANQNSRRRYPGIAQLTLGSSYNLGHYHSLQTQVMRRVRRGVNLMASYTWSKAMDIDSSGTFGTALQQGPRDAFNLRGDYAPADSDATHQFRTAVIYDLPKLRGGSAALRALANGWQANGMIVARTGFPVTCRSGVDNSLSAIGNDNCDQISANTTRPAGANPLQMWFNTAAFTVNAIGTYGNAGRNSLRRPGMFNSNASLFRRFRLTEKLQTEFRVEAFNLLNHASFRLFYNPGAYISTITRTSPTFGQVTYADDPRLIQLALKLRF